MVDLWKPEFDRDDVEIIEQPIVYSGHVQILRYRLRFRLFRGSWSDAFVREVISRRPAVVVIPYDPVENKVVLIEQFRIPVIGSTDSPWILEPVAGLIDDGETPEETVSRETLEEAGCEIIDLMPCLKYFPSPGILNELSYVYIARVKIPEKQGLFGLLEEGEDIRTHIFSLEDALNLLEAGLQVSASGIIALQWLQIHIEKVRKAWL
jgi:ADP-ribose pyrophosphatase